MPEQLETDDFIDTSDDGGEQEVTPPAAPADGKPGDKKGGKGDDPHEELRSLRARLSEAENAAQYWHGQARNGKPPAAAAPAEEETPTLSVDLVDAISSGNAKDIKKALGELGFVDRATMDAHVRAARSQGNQETAIYSSFPELRDSNSEFFKATQTQFAALVEDGMDPNSLATTRAAAKLAKAELAADTGRDARVRRQSGDRGRAPARGGSDDELDPIQLRIIQGFQAAGASSVTAESYDKRAKAGIRMSGVKTRRAS